MSKYGNNFSATLRNFHAWFFISACALCGLQFSCMDFYICMCTFARIHLYVYLRPQNLCSSLVLASSVRSFGLSSVPTGFVCVCVCVCACVCAVHHRSFGSILAFSLLLLRFFFAPSLLFCSSEQNVFVISSRSCSFSFWSLASSALGSFVRHSSFTIFVYSFSFDFFPRRGLRRV